MPVYLNPRELGFDPQTIGFTAVQGALAVVLVCETGLFGFHNSGGTEPDGWAVRCKAFARFYQAHAQSSLGVRLYGVTALNSRGYESPAAAEWRAELESFADALDSGGGIRGLDLGTSAVRGPAFVEMRRSGNKCQIWLKAWDVADQTLGPIADGANHARAGAPRSEAPLSTVVTAVDPTGTVRGHSIRLA